MIKINLIVVFLFVIKFSAAQEFNAKIISPKYDVHDGYIVGKNTGIYNNRPLYINNTTAFILAGDQPIARFAKDDCLYGTFMLAIIRDNKSKWLQNCDNVISYYRAGRMMWKVSDSSFPDLQITIEVLPLVKNIGMTLHIKCTGGKKGDKFLWTYGGAQVRKEQQLAWKLDLYGQPEVMLWGFVPDECKYNEVKLDNTSFSTVLSDSIASKEKYLKVSGSFDFKSETSIGDASEWENPISFAASIPNRRPIVKGEVDIENDKDYYIAFQGFKMGMKNEIPSLNSPWKAFEEGIKRTNSFTERLQINTPDKYLDAVAESSVAATDGVWIPPVFVHSGMQWKNPYPGWRTIFGATMYGWHDRVMEQAKYYIGYQIKESDKKIPKADPKLLLTGQDADSRFYGAGRINKDQAFYNMQTQFFDQILEDWRWTADLKLENVLRNALELHLKWIKDCFDPDADGVYESYINTWPTDSQWYNGGGTAEETSYAYRGHRAARDMARRAGDKASETYHAEMLEKIKKGFFEKLWIQDMGHSGAYREQGGYQRLHKDPWLYSIFLPIDAGLTSQFQAIESVYYSEWALQNDIMPAGGRKVWTSNWIPSIWSVRELWPGDNYHLALSYFQAGLPNDGWDIMKGNYMHSAFNNHVPGDLASEQGGIDFGDCTPTFARALVAGMFGYQPDYPNQSVVFSPQFPTDWNHASIEIPDVKISFKRADQEYNYQVHLAHRANLTLNLPVSSGSIEEVLANGQSIKWIVLPSVGRSIVQIHLSGIKNAEVSIKTGKIVEYFPPTYINVSFPNKVILETKGAQIVECFDLQNILRDQKIENGILSADLAVTSGHHTIIVKSMLEKMPQWRVFRVKVLNPKEESRNDSRFVKVIPRDAIWKTIDIQSQLNADVRTIFQEKYLSPRPNTVSVRIGIDGYSPWTFPYWSNKPPDIKLDSVGKYLNDKNEIITTQNVPFKWYGVNRNIAFTSLWDNFPKATTFPIHQKGEAIYFLICGSTNVMQCNIANAVLRINYSDGTKDSLELIPPINYWNLSHIGALASVAGQSSVTDYSVKRDGFCLPKVLPERVQLGTDCRAMLLNLRLKKGIEVESISLATLSQEVVVGLMGATIMNPEP